ncbi:hypothetical protein Tco_0548060 [Tanacetum coccineum]
MNIPRHQLLAKHLEGFVISDWQGIDMITTPSHANCTYSILAGMNVDIDKVIRRTDPHQPANIVGLSEPGSTSTRDIRANSTEPNAPTNNVDNTVVGNYGPSHQHVSTRITMYTSNGFGSYQNITLNTQCVHSLDSTSVCHTDLCRPQSVVFPEHETASGRRPGQPWHSLCGYSTTTNSVLRVVRNPILHLFAVTMNRRQSNPEYSPNSLDWPQPRDQQSYDIRVCDYKSDPPANN